MLNSKQIVKLGRKDKILEINDKLHVNDFYCETGFDFSTLHGRFSRIQLVLVDTKDGKKDKAKVGKYNFLVEDLKNIVQVLGLTPNPQTYKEKALAYNRRIHGKENDFLSGFKINKYEKLPNGKSPTSNIKLSYEDAMRNDSKWKVTIDLGEAIPEEKGNLITPKNGTYKKLNTATMNITQLELEELIQTTWNYLKLWEQASFPKMLEYRKAFEDRCEENDFNEKTIKVWNSNPNLKTKHSVSHTNKERNQQNAQQRTSSTEKNVPQKEVLKSNGQSDSSTVSCKCEGKDCKAIINSQSIIDYSKKFFNGKVFCMSCQSKMKKRTA